MTGYTGMWKPPASFRNLHPHPNCTQSVAVNNGLFARAAGHIQWVVVGGCSGSVCWCRVPWLQGECIFFFNLIFFPRQLLSKGSRQCGHTFTSVFSDPSFFLFCFFTLKLLLITFRAQIKVSVFIAHYEPQVIQTLLRVLNQSNSMKRTHLYGCGCWVFCQK